jgi:serine/threonine-protein kinase HipA
MPGLDVSQSPLINASQLPITCCLIQIKDRILPAHIGFLLSSGIYPSVKKPPVMSATIHVSIQSPDALVSVGQLWPHPTRPSASFAYASSWLDNPSTFALDPFLPLNLGTHNTEPGQALFGAFADTLPDRWGRALLKASESATLSEAQLLCRVPDHLRQGALRFSTGSTTSIDAAAAFAPVHADYSTVPRICDLPAVLRASRQFEANHATGTEIAILLPSIGLGGAHAKALVRDEHDALWLAKLPSAKDEIDLVRWEWVCLSLAQLCGIDIPQLQLKTIDRAAVLLIKRFDRNPQPVPFLSGMSVVGAPHGQSDNASYLDLCRALQPMLHDPGHDLPQLWRRLVFSLLIGNEDDHLRNHAILRSSDGWHLSPAFDLTPTSARYRTGKHALKVGGDASLSPMEQALTTCHDYGLDLASAQRIVKQISDALPQWRTLSRQAAIPSSQAQSMSSCFAPA